jgi:hypothetical protein
VKLRKNWVLLARGYAVHDPDLYNERETGKVVSDRKRKCQAPAYTAWIQVSDGRVRTHGEVPRDVVLAVLGHEQNRKA